MLLMVVLYVIEQINFSRSMIAMFYGINIVLTTISRSLIRMLSIFRKKDITRSIFCWLDIQAREEYINRINSIRSGDMLCVAF